MSYMKLLILLMAISSSPAFFSPLCAAQATEDADIDDDEPDVFPDEESVDMDTEPDEDIILMEEDEDSQ